MPTTVVCQPPVHDLGEHSPAAVWVNAVSRFGRDTDAVSGSANTASVFSTEGANVSGNLGSSADTDARRLPGYYSVDRLKQLDEIRTQTHQALSETNVATIVDILFTTDRQWGAPLADGGSGGPIS